jgi:integrase
VQAVGVHRCGKSNSIRDLLVKIARREHLEILEGDTTPFSDYASSWLERKKATLARSTYGDYRSIWRKYVLPYFGSMPLEVNNLRKRAWYPAIASAGLRRRTMYQTRHTFASLMLSHGEDPFWVARMLGHTGLEMIFKHYGKFIRNRSRKDGGRFLEGLREARSR